MTSHLHTHQHTHTHTHAHTYIIGTHSIGLGDLWPLSLLRCHLTRIDFFSSFPSSLLLSLPPNVSLLFSLSYSLWHHSHSPLLSFLWLSHLPPSPMSRIFCSLSLSLSICLSLSYTEIVRFQLLTTIKIYKGGQLASEPVIPDMQDSCVSVSVSILYIYTTVFIGRLCVCLCCVCACDRWRFILC